MSTNRRKKLRAIIERLIPERNEHCIYFENGRQHSGLVGNSLGDGVKSYSITRTNNKHNHPNSQKETNKNTHTHIQNSIRKCHFYIYIKCIFRI